MKKFENYEACKKQVNELMAELKREDAIITLSEYIDTDPRCYKAYYYKADILRQKGIYERIDFHTQCIEIYDQCINIDRTNYEPYLEKVNFLLGNNEIENYKNKTENNKKAIEVLDTYINYISTNSPTDLSKCYKAYFYKAELL